MEPLPPPALQVAVLGQDSVRHRRLRSEASDWNLGFRGGVTLMVGKLGGEPGEGQMGNVVSRLSRWNRPARSPAFRIPVPIESLERTHTVQLEPLII